MNKADKFVNDKLGDKNYTHSPYPMHRAEIAQWLDEYVQQCLHPHHILNPPNYELGFCEICIQMTNHLDGVCQKCKGKTPEVEFTPELAQKIKDAANRIAADSLKADHVLVPQENIQLVADELGVTFEEAVNLLDAEFKPKS